MRRSLDRVLETPVLPRGLRLGDCLAVDLVERVDAHRDAWTHLDHIGLPGATSRFTLERYQRLRRTPGYDPGLDLIVEATDGVIAACCICWLDEENGIGLFEPVGTRLAYRRRGIARAIVLEGLRRLRERGMHTAMIGTASVNQPALGAYLSCGFEVVDRDFEYTLDLPRR
jgi:ribosomal protein S18 acetylase RimI-like enzyme